jgi:hypothetical protein
MQNHTRRRFLESIGVTAAWVGAHSFPGGFAQARLSGRQKRRPNVLFPFTDDQRFDTIGGLEDGLFTGLEGEVMAGLLVLVWIHASSFVPWSL